MIVNCFFRIIASMPCGIGGLEQAFSACDEKTLYPEYYSRRYKSQQSHANMSIRHAYGKHCTFRIPKKRREKKKKSIYIHLTSNNMGSVSHFCRHQELRFFLCWLKNLERAHQVFVNNHHSTCIIKFTTVVWG